MSIQRTDIVQIEEGIAYIPSEMTGLLQHAKSEFTRKALPSVIIDESYNFVKSRYDVNDMVKVYIIVNAIPELRLLVNLLNRVFMVVARIEDRG